MDMKRTYTLCGISDRPSVRLKVSLLNKTIVSCRTMCYELFILNPKRLDEVLPYRGPKMWLLKFFLSRVLRKELWNQGIGRHSDEEIWDIGRRDLNAISDFLGNHWIRQKLFFFICSFAFCLLFLSLLQQVDIRQLIMEVWKHRLLS